MSSRPVCPKGLVAHLILSLAMSYSAGIVTIIIRLKLVQRKFANLWTHRAS